MRHPIKLDFARARMATLGLTQQEIAARCGVDVRTVQRWFAGQGVSLADAERVAALLGVGTRMVFRDVPAEAEGLVPSSLRRVLRLLSGRENAFAQGLRLVAEHYDVLNRAVSFAAHPTDGYVTRVSLGNEPCHGFVVLRVQMPEREGALTLFAQLGQRFAFSIGRVRVVGPRVELLETFCTHSMVAELGLARAFDLWLWGGLDNRELLFVSEQPVQVTRLERPVTTVLDLASSDTKHAVCFRPSPHHLRGAGLPPGFDRIEGERTGRVDVALDG